MADRLPLAVRFRRAFYRRAVRRTLVAVVALATAVSVATSLRAVDQARGRWGETRPVALARRDLDAGENLDSSAVEVRDLPVAIVSEAALGSPPVGAVVRYPVAAGEPLVADRFAPQGLSGVAALVPQGHRAIGLPQGQLGSPPLEVGDLVDVLVVLPPGSGMDEGTSGHEHPDDGGLRQGLVEPAFPLATGVRVVDVNEQLVTVAVATSDAPRLAYAVASGVVVLTLTGN